MLTGRQKEITSYYYNDDLSLSEISELTGITRQGARECIKKAENTLEELEKNLCMYENYISLSAKLTRLRREISSLAEKYGVPPDNEKLVGINTIIESILQ